LPDEREPRDRGSDFSPRLSRIRSTAAARSRCLARKHVPAVEETTIAGRSTSTVRLQEDVWVDERGWLVQRKMKRTSRISGEELADTLRCSPTTSSRDRRTGRGRLDGRARPWSRDGASWRRRGIVTDAGGTSPAHRRRRGGRARAANPRRHHDDRSVGAQRARFNRRPRMPTARIETPIDGSSTAICVLICCRVARLLSHLRVAP
jgi:hypothetical protein